MCISPEKTCHCVTVHEKYGDLVGQRMIDPLHTGCYLSSVSSSCSQLRRHDDDVSHRRSA